MGQPPNPVSQLQQVQNALQAPGSARANLLTNGGFEIWQRGNGPFTTSVFTADRWSIQLGGSEALSVSRDTTNVDAGSGAAMAVTASAITGLGSNVNQTLNETVGQIKTRTVTASVRVRTNVANAVRLQLLDPALQVSSNFHSGSGAYETLTATWTFSGSATQVVCRVAFFVNCTAYLDNAMLVVGSVPADYAPLHPADDFARCLRYYETSSNGGSELVFTANGTASNAVQSPMQWRVMKAVTPTVTKVGTWNVVNCGQPATGLPNVYGYQLYAVASATGLVSFYNGTAGSFITSEANP